VSELVSQAEISVLESQIAYVAVPIFFHLFIGIFGPSNDPK
jgi:hypothetical protein